MYWIIFPRNSTALSLQHVYGMVKQCGIISPVHKEVIVVQFGISKNLLKIFKIFNILIISTVVADSILTRFIVYAWG